MVKSKILLVDDDMQLCSCLKKILVEKDYAVIIQLSATAAIDVLTDENFDLIITDINMPVISGITLFKNIRKHAPLTPIIIITGDTTPKTTEEVKRLKAFGCIIKPFEAQEVYSLVEKAAAYSSHIKNAAKRQL